MSKWKNVRVRQELLAAVESALEGSNYNNLSEFVSEAIQMRLDELRQKREKTLAKSPECPVIRDRLFYTTSHMWTMVTPEGNVRLGLSDYAQTHMEGIAKAQIDPIGSDVTKEKSFGSVETWMFKFELQSPVAGKIIKTNEAVKNDPSIINKDPYEAGWIAEIRPDNAITLEEELRDLMKPHQYKTWVSKVKFSSISAT